MKNHINGLVVFSMLILCSCAKSLHTGRQVSYSYYNTAEPIFRKASVPMKTGFAHNDYCHEHPLYDALENGFTNIEADIFLKNNKLIVAHIFPYFKEHRTLEALYLQPLFERITKNGGKVYPGYDTPVILMIDIKTNAYNTYKALKPVLEKYKSILTGYENGKVIYRAITIVLSGNKPYELIKNEQNRLAFIDENIYKIPCYSVNDNLFTMASCKYSDLISWDGSGTISTSEKSTLCAFVAIAHKMGAKVRLWASPENEAVWSELLNCGVDLINTDELVAFKNYFIARQMEVVNDKKTLSAN